jgi:hypothetical protein
MISHTEKLLQASIELNELRKENRLLREQLRIHKLRELRASRPAKDVPALLRRQAE